MKDSVILINTILCVIFTYRFTGISHGDDLPFIFDPEPLDGNTSFSGLALTDHNDQKVQDIVTNFIAEFARTG